MKLRLWPALILLSTLAPLATAGIVTDAICGKAVSACEANYAAPGCTVGRTDTSTPFGPAVGAARRRCPGDNSDEFYAGSLYWRRSYESGSDRNSVYVYTIVLGFLISANENQEFGPSGGFCYLTVNGGILGGTFNHMCGPAEYPGPPQIGYGHLLP